MFYEEIFKELNHNKVKYAVAGGVATVLHGVVRFTADLDLIIDMSPNNIDKFFSALDRLGYRPRVPATVEEFKDPKKRKEWITEKNMKVFSFFHPKNPLKVVDVLIDEAINYKKIKKVIYKAKGIAIPTISVNDLKKLKKKAGRPRDLADIQSLEEIGKMREKK